jgi:hypothetical protein
LQEQSEVTTLHFLRRGARRDLKAEILLGPPPQAIRHILSKLNQGGLTVSYGDLGESRPVFVRHIRPLGEQNTIRKKTFLW